MAFFFLSEKEMVAVPSSFQFHFRIQSNIKPTTLLSTVAEGACQLRDYNYFNFSVHKDYFSL